MQSKEVKKWQDEEALRRYQMIAPLLDEDLDEAKRRQLREEIAEKHEISKRSLYRYEAKYREEAFSGLRPMNREKRRSQALPENYDGDFSEAAKKRIENMSRIGQANEKYAMDVAKEMEQRFRDGTLNYHYQPEHRLYGGIPLIYFEKVYVKID